MSRPLTETEIHFRQTFERIEALLKAFPLTLSDGAPNAKIAILRGDILKILDGYNRLKQFGIVQVTRSMQPAERASFKERMSIRPLSQIKAITLSELDGTIGFLFKLLPAILSQFLRRKSHTPPSIQFTKSLISVFEKWIPKVFLQQIERTLESGVQAKPPVASEQKGAEAVEDPWPALMAILNDLIAARVEVERLKEENLSLRLHISQASGQQMAAESTRSASPPPSAEKRSTRRAPEEASDDAVRSPVRISSNGTHMPARPAAGFPLRAFAPPEPARGIRAMTLAPAAYPASMGMFAPRGPGPSFKATQVGRNTSFQAPKEIALPEMKTAADQQAGLPIILQAVYGQPEGLLRAEIVDHFVNKHRSDGADYGVVVFCLIYGDLNEVYARYQNLFVQNGFAERLQQVLKDDQEKQKDTGSLFDRVWLDATQQKRALLNVLQSSLYNKVAPKYLPQTFVTNPVTVITIGDKQVYLAEIASAEINARGRIEQKSPSRLARDRFNEMLEELKPVGAPTAGAARMTMA